MWRIKTVFFFFLNFLIVSLFYNCTPIALKGEFKDPGISISHSQSSSGQSTTGGSKDGDSTDDDNPAGDSTEDDNPDGDSTEDDNPDGDSTEDDNTDGDSTEDDNTDGDSTEPIGEEFSGEETPDTGKAPITRKLY